MIWGFIVRFSQNGLDEDAILDMLKQLPTNNIDEEARSWFHTENSHEKGMEEDFFTFLQQRSSVITQKPTIPVPTHASIEAVAGTSLDFIQQSDAWQAIGLDPGLTTWKMYMPQTPPQTPTPPYQINIPTSPHLDFDLPTITPEVIYTLTSDDGVPIEDVLVPNPTQPFPTSHVKPKVTGLTLNEEVNHTLTSGMHNGKLLQSDPPLVPLCSHFTPDVTLSMDNGGPKVHNMDLDPDLPSQHDVCQPKDVRHSNPMPMELEKELLAASTSSPAGPVRSSASDPGSTLAQTLNEAFKTNHKQPNSENRKGNGISKLSKNILQKTDDKSYKATSRSNSDNSTTKPPKHKNEVIDLTLEEVSFSI